MIDTFCKALVGMGKGFMYFCFMVFLKLSGMEKESMSLYYSA